MRTIALVLVSGCTVGEAAPQTFRAELEDLGIREGGGSGGLELASSLRASPPRISAGEWRLPVDGHIALDDWSVDGSVILDGTDPAMLSWHRLDSGWAANLELHSNARIEARWVATSIELDCTLDDQPLRNRHQWGTPGTCNFSLSRELEGREYDVDWATGSATLKVELE